MWEEEGRTLSESLGSHRREKVSQVMDNKEDLIFLSDVHESTWRMG